jgi:hypothetical protein
LSSPIPEEIATDLLNQTVPGLSYNAAGYPDIEPTVAQFRELLKPLGLDITTTEAVDWGVGKPILARHATQICSLEQQIADLDQPPQTEKKEAAE